MHKNILEIFWKPLKEFRRHVRLIRRHAFWSRVLKPLRASCHCMPFTHRAKLLLSRVAFSKQSLDCAKPGIVQSRPRLKLAKNCIYILTFQKISRQSSCVLWLCSFHYSSQIRKVYKRNIKPVSFTCKHKEISTKNPTYILRVFCVCSEDLWYLLCTVLFF